MGDGKRLKEFLDRKGMSVRQIARASGISATTLYSIIQNDSSVRLDFALKLSNQLEIGVNEICSNFLFPDALQDEIGKALLLFSRLDDEARREVVQIMQFKLQKQSKKIMEALKEMIKDLACIIVDETVLIDKEKYELWTQIEKISPMLQKINAFINAIGTNHTENYEITFSLKMDSSSEMACIGFQDTDFNAFRTEREAFFQYLEMALDELYKKNN